MTYRRYHFLGRKNWFFEVFPKRIVLHRHYREDSVELLGDEGSRIESFRQAHKIYTWYYFHGLEHRLPHPFGISAYDLHCEYVNRLHACGQTWAKKESFDDWMRESIRIAQRDGCEVLPDGSLKEVAA